jgi:hypothetical protein
MAEFVFGNFFDDPTVCFIFDARGDEMVNHVGGLFVPLHDQELLKGFGVTVDK